jgi:phospholipase C
MTKVALRNDRNLTEFGIYGGLPVAIRCGVRRDSEMRNINLSWLRRTTVTKSILPLIVSVQLAGSFVELSRSAAQTTSRIPIQHFIFIIQENRSFDNYFGTFPGANGIPIGTTLPDYPGGPLVEHPFLGGSKVHDMSHSWVAAQLAYNNGAMDGFLWAEWPEGLNYYGKSIATPKQYPTLVKVRKETPAQPGVKPSASSSTPVANPGAEEILSRNGFADGEDPDDPGFSTDSIDSTTTAHATPPPISDRPAWVKNSFSYLDYTVIPNYWAYALNYTLCDAFFSAVAGPSHPNHLYSVAAQSGGVATNLPNADSWDYLFPSMVDLLGNGHVTWSYYVDGEPPTHESWWNPLPGFKAYEEQKGFDVTSHLAATSQFYTDIKSGTLPQVSYLIPAANESEHPPYNAQTGMWYVTGLVNAVMQSNYWQSCAIIILWDDYGGFYDHVPPPRKADLLGDGFRVPALVVSPYSRVGVNHTSYDLTSLLKLVETAFSLPSLTGRDGTSNTMLECFNFSQKPLPPLVITSTTKLDFSKLVATKP